MSSIQENALTVFEEHFVPAFREGGPLGWSLVFNDEHEATESGMTLAEEVAALRLLRRLGFIRQVTMAENYGLGDLGVEACIDISVLKNALCPVREDAVAASQVFNISTVHGPSQFGNQNIQNIVTHTTVLQHIVEEIERAPLPPEEKRTLLEHARALLESKSIQSILDAAVGAGAGAYVQAKLGGM